MSAGPSIDHQKGLASWDVAVGTGQAPERLLLEPDAGLDAVRDDGVEWRSRSERACFGMPLQTLPGSGLPAGWYEIEGRLVSSDDSPLSPALYPAYARGADGDAQIALPDPGSDGRIRSLVLFKYPVSSLRFSPAMGRARFRMEGFRLHRISRPRALAHMLLAGGGARAGAGRPGARLRRLGHFLAEIPRRGLSRATDALFRDYRRGLLPEGVGDYTGWAMRFDAITAERLEDLRARATHLGPHGPSISLLVPVYQTPERWLRRCIESVIAQAYANWQLCLVDDASPDPRVMEILREYADRDTRIEVARRDDNGHISASSNTALGMARGEFVALLDHDDELRPHALLEVAEAIAAQPDLGLIYSDEDKIDEQGRRFDPYFKPDWDPDLLRSQNYVCHFTTIRTDLARSVGGFREGYEGSQDHDLILRCTERLLPLQIRHIPRVLYHWRAIPGSTALTRDAKDYASSAGVRAVSDHLARRHPGARAEELSHGHYRVHWPMPDPAPKVSLVVPTRDRADLLRMCIESILARTVYPDFEVVVVDNQSTDPDALAYMAALERDGRARVLRYDAPFNYSAINNWAVRQCDGDVIGLVNNDIEVISPDWLQEMASQAIRREIGAVGAMLYYPDDRIQHAGVILGIHGVGAHIYAGMPRGYPGHGGRARVVQSLSAVTAACLLVRREAYESVGGLDERLRVAFNDVDFCLRLREAGYRNLWTPFAELYHHESASRGHEDTEEKKQRFAGEVEFMRQRWGDTLLADPAYNANLSLSSLYCELPVPPRQ
jgi:GT2 family glycosyltransferase